MICVEELLLTALINSDLLAESRLAHFMHFHQLNQQAFRVKSFVKNFFIQKVLLSFRVRHLVEVEKGLSEHHIVIQLNTYKPLLKE